MKAKNILSGTICHSTLDAESPAKMRLRIKSAMTYDHQTFANFAVKKSKNDKVIKSINR